MSEQEKRSITLLGSNLTIVPLEEAKDDEDFKSFINCSKGNFPDVKYLVFFKTESVHVGINRNGIRFFDSDLKKAKRPFMYAPVKYEHDGPIIGTVISGKYKKNDQGIGTIETKGILWTLENTDTVSNIIYNMINNPSSCHVSLECYYNPPEYCDYGIGNKRISYNKFLKLLQYKGRDYNGQGIVWQRANNPTFTGLAFVYDPADLDTKPNIIGIEEAGVLQRAYASFICNSTFCPNCGYVLPNSKEEGKAMRKTRKEEEYEELEEYEEEIEEEEIEEEEIEEDEIEEETEEEVEEEEEEEADTEKEEPEEEESEEEPEDSEGEDDSGEEEDEEDIETEDEEEEEEENKPKPTKKKVIIRKVRVKKPNKVSKTKKQSDKYALRLDEVERKLNEIEEVFKAMKL